MKKSTRIIIEAVLGLILILSLVYVVKSQIDSETASKETTEEAVNDIPAELCYSYGDVEMLVNKMANSDEEKMALSKLFDPLNKSNPITVGYIYSVFDTLGIPKGKNLAAIASLDSQTYVTKEQFDEIYDHLAGYELVEGLIKNNIYVFSISNVVDENGNEKIYLSDSNKEYPVTCNEDVEDYLDCIIEVYQKNDEIFKIKGLSQKAFVAKDVWISDVSGGNISFVYKNASKQYPQASVSVAEDGEDDYSSFLDEAKSGMLADIVISNSGVAGVRENTNVREVRVLETTDYSLVVENVGSLKYDETIKIYDVSKEAFCEQSVAVLAGHKKVGLVYESGRASVAIINDELVSDSIRVILNNDDFTSYEMDRITVSSDDEFEIEYPDETVITYEPRREITFDLEEYKNKDVIKVKSTDPDGKIKVLSINRGCGNPEYRGTVEVDVYKDYMYIINELPLEEYLYSVVSSEMGEMDPPEALKAQALCARGYAFTKMEDKSYSDYKADLDDSVNCQVYNNIAETEGSIKAVKDTYGLICTYNGKPIVPLYFSTSCGVTCSNEEIWGGTSYDYMRTNVENLNKDYIELSEEDTFKEFIDNPDKYDIIEKEMPYFRWSVEYTVAEITEAINSTLDDRMEMSSENIKVQNSNGKFVEQSIDTIGAVEKIEITERSNSGVVSKMIITGSENTIEITGQTNIRNIITPIKREIIKSDGSVATGWTSLPSPFYYIEQTDDGYVIKGGGFGHGVGMSQTGARVLAEKGYNFRFIINHYYYPTDFTMAYDVMGEEEEE